MRFIRITGFFLLFAVILSSCEKNTNTNPIPNITFKSFTPSVTGDSATLQVNFTDGDGDIGYPSQDPTAPYNFFVQVWYTTDTNAPSIAQFPADTVFKPYMSTIKINDSTYLTDTTTNKFHVPDITPAGKDKSLTGVIQILLYSPWYPVTAVTPWRNYFVYKVWLYDRAGHKSNVLTTPIEQGL